MPKSPDRAPSTTERLPAQTPRAEKPRLSPEQRRATTERLRRLTDDEAMERAIRLESLSNYSRKDLDAMPPADRQILLAKNTQMNLNRNIAAHIKEKYGIDNASAEALLAHPERFSNKFSLPGTSKVPFVARVSNFIRNRTDAPVDYELAKQLKEWTTQQQTLEKMRAFKGEDTSVKSTLDETPLMSPVLSERARIAKQRARRLSSYDQDGSTTARQRRDAEAYRDQQNMPPLKESYASTEEAEKDFYHLDVDNATEDEINRWMKDNMASDEEMKRVPDRQPVGVLARRQGGSSAGMGGSSSLERSVERVGAIPVSESRKGTSKKSYGPNITEERRKISDEEEIAALNRKLRENVASPAEMARNRRQPMGVLARRRDGTGGGSASLERATERVGALPLQESAELSPKQQVELMRPLYNKIRARQNQLANDRTDTIRAASPLRNLRDLNTELSGFEKELQGYHNHQDSKPYQYLTEQITKLRGEYEKRRNAEADQELNVAEHEITDMRADLALNPDMNKEQLDAIQLRLRTVEKSMSQLWDTATTAEQKSRYELLLDLLISCRERYSEARNQQESKALIRDVKDYRGHTSVDQEISTIQDNEKLREKADLIYNGIVKQMRQLSDDQQNALFQQLKTNDVGTAYAMTVLELDKAFAALRRRNAAQQDPIAYDGMLRRKGDLIHILENANALLGLPKEVNITKSWSDYVSESAQRNQPKAKVTKINPERKKAARSMDNDLVGKTFTLEHLDDPSLRIPDAEDRLWAAERQAAMEPEDRKTLVDNVEAPIAEGPLHPELPSMIIDPSLLREEFENVQPKKSGKRLSVVPSEDVQATATKNTSGIRPSRPAASRKRAANE